MTSLQHMQGTPDLMTRVCITCHKETKLLHGPKLHKNRKRQQFLYSAFEGVCEQKSETKVETKKKREEYVKTSEEKITD
jgi:hypothetical protein